MSVVLEAGTQPVTRWDDGTPSDLLEVINRHLAGHIGLPTPEIVATICKDPDAVFRVSKVLRYFIIQSPLRPRDLGMLCMANDSAHATSACKAALAERKRLIAVSDGRWKPRWEGAPTS
jgi:hypothetical protein